MGNCKDCRFWKHCDSGMGEKWDECEAADGGSRRDLIPEDGFAVYAEALDDSGLETGLKTGPMFGCIKFHPRT